MVVRKIGTHPIYCGHLQKKGCAQFFRFVDLGQGIISFSNYN